jgi:hypothetical protein
LGPLKERPIGGGLQETYCSLQTPSKPPQSDAAREISTLPQPTAAALGDHAPLSPRHSGVLGGLGPAAGGGALPVALVLIDRGLDLATPCSHSDHFWDAVPALLRRRPAAPPPPACAAPGAWALHRSGVGVLGLRGARPAVWGSGRGLRLGSLRRGEGGARAQMGRLQRNPRQPRRAQPQAC